MERRAGSGPLGFSERSSTVKEYETLTREKVDVVPFGCGMPETHLMQDWSDRMLDLILNGPTINGIKKDEVRAMLRETYTALKQYEKIGPMASPFINDPTAIVARAFSELYPGVEYVAQYVPRPAGRDQRHRLRPDHLSRRRQHADRLHLGRGTHQRRP